MNLDGHHRIGVIGPSASGKTQLIKRLFYGPLRNKFDKVYLISPTAKLQDVWDELGVKKERRFDEPTNATFRKVMQEVMSKPKEDHCIILDDCVGTEILRINSELVQHCIKLRHNRCTIIIASQVIRKIPSVVRLNLDKLALFNVNNNKEITTLREEQAGIDEHYAEAVKEPYNYLYIDLEKNILDPERFKYTPL